MDRTRHVQRSHRLQFPLWIILFVLPAVAAIACAYFSLVYRLDQQILRKIHQQEEKRQAIIAKQKRLQNLQYREGSIRVHIWQAKEDSLRRLEQQAKHQKRTSYLGLAVHWEDLRYFTEAASDDELHDLLTQLRPVAENHNADRQRQATRFLADLPRVTGDRFEKFREPACGCLKDLTKSADAEVAEQADRLLKAYQGKLEEASPP